MKKIFQQLTQTAFSVLLIITSSAVCFGQAKAPQIKVEVETVQKQTIKTEIGSTPNKSDHLININLINQTGNNQNLKSINITITPTILIPKGTVYLKGADQMQDHEGQMMKMKTGEKRKYNNSNMYLMFKRGEADYLLVGLISWRTFLSNIITEGGVIKIIGDGDGKELKARQRVAFDKVVYMQDKSWQDLQERYAAVIAKENEVNAPQNVNWTGWATWDFYVQKYLAQDVESNTEAIKNLNVPTNIIQLDGGWWKHRGDYLETRDDLPGGITGMVEKIHKAGFKAGFHFDGMRASKAANIVKEHPEYFIHTENGALLEIGKDPITKQPIVFWDYSHPGATAYIKKVMKNAKENWKIDYFKIDFLRHGLFKGVSHLPVTNVERFRMGITAMKEGFGDEVYFLACSSNFGTMIGLSDGARTGGDIHPNYETVKTRAQHASASYYFHPKLFNLDPDYVVLRSEEETNERDGKKPSLSYDEAAMWANYVSIYGNARFESDNIPLLKPEKKALIQKNFSMPFFNKTIPMDLWDHYNTYTDAPNFYLAKTDNGTICLSLFNWENKDASFTISGFKQDAGLKEFAGDAQFKTANGKLLVPLKGVHSILLKYEGKETFDQLRKELKMIVNKE